eukprot:Hpha_TRINITY_DN16802_c2_g1::TRINITY_DN16802_c2_g1_i1::g.151077::m.151077
MSYSSTTPRPLPVVARSTPFLTTQCATTLFRASPPSRRTDVGDRARPTLVVLVQRLLQHLAQAAHHGCGAGQSRPRHARRSRQQTTHRPGGPWPLPRACIVVSACLQDRGTQSAAGDLRAPRGATPSHIKNLLENFPPATFRGQCSLTKAGLQGGRKIDRRGEDIAFLLVFVLLSS